MLSKFSNNTLILLLVLSPKSRNCGLPVLLGFPRWHMRAPSVSFSIGFVHLWGVLLVWFDLGFGLVLALVLMWLCVPGAKDLGM